VESWQHQLEKQKEPPMTLAEFERRLEDRGWHCKISSRLIKSPSRIDFEHGTVTLSYAYLNAFDEGNLEESPHTAKEMFEQILFDIMPAKTTLTIVG